MKCSTCPFYEVTHDGNLCHKLHYENFPMQSNCDLGLKSKAMPIFKRQLIENGYIQIYFEALSGTNLGDEIGEYLYWFSRAELYMFNNEPMTLMFFEDGIEVESMQTVICLIPWELVDAEDIWHLRKMV